MTEVKAEGNILNGNQYPEIKDNTINLIVPLHNEIEKEMSLQRFNTVFDMNEINRYKIFALKHHLNGCFLVFQAYL